METPMTSWNDDRLDELNGQVDHGFKAVDKRFEQVDKRFEQVASREEIAEVRAELRYLNERFDRLYYTLLVIVIVGVGNLFVN
jgi:hypothetical protein